MDGVRIVLLGKQGAGKSAAGNTLLRQHVFETGAHTKRITQTCSMHTSAVNNHKITVVDTPGWPDSLSEPEIKQEIMKCFDMCSPGPHVFLLVLPIGRFTEEEINTARDILLEFGGEVFKHMLLLFTRGDDLEEKSIEEYLENVHKDLKSIQKNCEGYHVFNNKDKSDHLQVFSLLKKISDMVEKNYTKCYTKTMYNVKIQQRRDEICLAKVENLAQNDTVLKKLERKDEICSEKSETESEKVNICLVNEQKRAPLQDDEKMRKTTNKEMEQSDITIQKRVLELEEKTRVQAKQIERLVEHIGNSNLKMNKTYYDKVTKKACCLLM